MLEKEIERRMCELVKKRGGLFYKFTSPDNPGVPDRILVTPAGDVWFVELKRTFGRMSRIQHWQKSELEKRGVKVRVIHGYDEAKKFVEEVLPGVV
jgi:hypothetical protein